MRRCYGPVHELLAQIMDIEFRDTVSLQAITDCIAQGDAENAAKHTAAYINKGQHAIDQALSLLPSNQGH